jgi:hypothetical protein
MLGSYGGLRAGFLIADAVLRDVHSAFTGQRWLDT